MSRRVRREKKKMTEVRRGRREKKQRKKGGKNDEKTFMDIPSSSNQSTLDRNQNHLLGEKQNSGICFTSFHPVAPRGVTSGYLDLMLMTFPS